MADRCKWWWTATAKHCLSCCFDDSKLSLKTSFPFTGKNTIINADGGQLFVTEVRFRYCLHHWFLYGKCWNPCYKTNEVKRLTMFKYSVFLVYPVRRKCANPLSLKSACPKLSMSERIEKQGYLPSKLVANIEDITNFIFSCWKYLSLSSEANEWEILSAREDKFVSPSGHAMFCLFYRCWRNSYIKHNFFYYY